MRAIRRFTVRPVLPDALASLGELAANLRWSWHPPTQALFEEIDAERWRTVGHDPLRMLGEVSAERWAELVADEDYVRRVADVRADLASYLSQDRWYQRAGAAVTDGTWPTSIAYFSP